MSKETRPEKNGNCWHCNAELPYPLVSCCSGRECGCMGWPTEFPFCNDECYIKRKEAIRESQRLNELHPVGLGDDLPF